MELSLVEVSFVNDSVGEEKFSFTLLPTVLDGTFVLAA